MWLLWRRGRTSYWRFRRISGLNTILAVRLLLPVPGWRRGLFSQRSLCSDSKALEGFLQGLDD